MLSEEYSRHPSRTDAGDGARPARRRPAAAIGRRRERSDDSIRRRRSRATERSSRRAAGRWLESAHARRSPLTADDRRRGAARRPPPRSGALRPRASGTPTRTTTPSGRSSTGRSRSCSPSRPRTWRAVVRFAGDAGTDRRRARRRHRAVGRRERARGRDRRLARAHDARARGRTPRSGTSSPRPGVINDDLRQAVAAEGLWYPPDPASYRISTIGGNVATNAGGICCVKYGVTRDYVLGMTRRARRRRGRAASAGARRRARPATTSPRSWSAPRARSGIITEVTLKLLPLGGREERAIVGSFASLEAAGVAVAAIRRGGHHPVRARARSTRCACAPSTSGSGLGLPHDAAALLLATVDEPGDAGAEAAASVARLDDGCRRARRRAGGVDPTRSSGCSSPGGWPTPRSSGSVRC